MSQPHLNTFLTSRRFKLGACVFGVVLAMSLAADTPSLANNSQAPARPSSSSPSNTVSRPAGGGNSASSNYNVQESGAVSSPPQTVAPPAGQPLMCPERATFSDMPNSCYHPCGGAQACGCSGRGTEMMCPLAE